MDTLDLYDRACTWNLGHVDEAAGRLDDPSPNPGWDVRTLLNHMLETQHYFTDSALGREAAPPSKEPPPLISGDPAADFRQARDQALDAFGADGVVDKTGPMIGIAFGDTLLHGWDLAVATGRDTTMPPDLAEAAYEFLYGRFTDDQRVGVFGPELPVSETASAQDKLLAYVGRDPALG